MSPEDQDRLRVLLTDTVLLLCKNGLPYTKGFSIEGLIGITVDQNDVFLVSLREEVKAAIQEVIAQPPPPAVEQIQAIPSPPPTLLPVKRKAPSCPPAKMLKTDNNIVIKQEEDDRSGQATAMDWSLALNQLQATQDAVNNHHNEVDEEEEEEGENNFEHSDHMTHVNNLTKTPLDMRDADSFQFVCAACRLGFHDAATYRAHQQKNPLATALDMLDDRSNESTFDSSLPDNVRMFCCDVCNKSFRSESSFKVHQVIHTEAHKCQYCGKCFACNSKLRTHLSTHDSTLKLPCMMCNKSFAGPSELKRHSDIAHKPV
ncbi:hypothetical protein CAPTEDRAFT_221662 [Capitella teleta]|uniref:C2H2-type domain-containing protein n=1 Tax=Capitella teleta TaxID=283909 RepID=R7UAW1_CAPTE|nr:hypothetical protein CAPTEDRAFT_221662 [Capitella teleta]|eukprot:ELU00918.1 hypothetical protein CAPTEDRAFT_221662 [Capitella teleta]